MTVLETETLEIFEELVSNPVSLRRGCPVLERDLRITLQLPNEPQSPPPALSLFSPSISLSLDLAIHLYPPIQFQANSDELRLDMELEPGDVQFLHNHQILHARSAFSDHAPGRKKARWSV